MRKSLFLAFAALALGGIALAQNTAPAAPAAPKPLHSRSPLAYQFASRAELDKKMFRPGDTHSYVVSDHENFDVEFVERALITNHIENHVHWLDLVTVLEGEGTLAIGGKPVDPNYTNPAEPNGTKMTGAKIVPLHAGDFVIVPAGVWHIFSGTANRKLRYVIFKQRE